MNEAEGRANEIHTAHRQHIVLRYIIDDFPKEEPFDSAYAWMQLLRLKTTLIRHWRLEEQHIYPHLRNSHDIAIRNEATACRERMRALLEDCLAFCANWYDAGAIADNQRVFLVEWTMLREQLLRQFEAEEQGIYGITDSSCNCSCDTCG